MKVARFGYGGTASGVTRVSSLMLSKSRSLVLQFRQPQFSADPVRFVDGNVVDVDQIPGHCHRREVEEVSVLVVSPVDTVYAQGIPTRLLTALVGDHDEQPATDTLDLLARCLRPHVDRPGSTSTADPTTARRSRSARGVDVATSRRTGCHRNDRAGLRGRNAIGGLMAVFHASCTRSRERPHLFRKHSTHCISPDSSRAPFDGTTGGVPRKGCINGTALPP